MLEARGSRMGCSATAKKTIFDASRTR